jgi:membrane-associated phospholipid phosphatase
VRWSLPVCIGATTLFAHLVNKLRGGQLGAIDAPIQQWVRSARGAADHLMLAVTIAGSLWPMTLVTLGVVLLFVLRHRLREAHYLTLSAGGSLLLNVALKAALHRPRPTPSGVYLLPASTSFAFPSGHTMGSAGVVASALVLVWACRMQCSLKLAATVVGVAFAIGVGISRIYFGVHYPSDVLGGWLAAIAWVSAVTGWMYPKLLNPHATHSMRNS